MHRPEATVARTLWPWVLALSVIVLLVPVATPVNFADEASPPEGASDDWWSRVQKEIADSEYEITWQEEPRLPDLEAAWHAPNRAHGFRTYFTNRGIRVISRTEAAPSWEWSLRLVGYGRGEKSVAVKSAAPAPDANSIRYDRGEIVEWYINERRGLKQGFTLDVPPEDLTEAGFVATVHEVGPVGLDLALEGDLSPFVSSDGQAIDFVAPGGGRKVHYAGLVVTDATGRKLPAWLEVFSKAGIRGIRVVFSDDEAVYPVTVDPLATSPAWSVTGGQEKAYLGQSVATAGDVNGDGYSDVIVGAHEYDNGEEKEGRVFVFHGSSSGLSTVADWWAESDQASAHFGESVATAGDVNGDGYSDVIVGASEYDNGEENEGAAFVYYGSPTGLDNEGNRPSGTPINADWSAEGNQADSEFGASVATAGDVDRNNYSDVIVGAPQYGESNDGSAFVYHGSFSGLGTIAKWTAVGVQGGALLGNSVATAGDVNGDRYSDVIIGAFSYDVTMFDEGVALVYHGGSGGLDAGGSRPIGNLSNANWVGRGNDDNAEFGDSVSTAGDINGDGHADVIVGAPGYWPFPQNQNDQGAAFVFHGSASGLGAPGLPTNADWRVEAGDVDARLGDSVATLGDVNGDGYADVIIGASRLWDTVTHSGRVFVYHGSALGLTGAPEAQMSDADWVISGGEGDWLGNSVASAGDVNGDGYSDAITGAIYHSGGFTWEGRAWVFHGSVSGLATNPGWSAEGNQDGASHGFSVATAGDVNGDGHSDVIVGAPGFDGGDDGEGRVFVYHGTPTGLEVAPAWSAESNQTSAEFGFSVAYAGDVDADGYAEVIIGAPGFGSPPGQASEGGAFVFHGGFPGLPDGPLATPANARWRAESDQSGARLGSSVATAGDVNADGHADVIIGAPGYLNLFPGEGGVFVFHGSQGGLDDSGSQPIGRPGNANWTAESDQPGAAFGYSVASAGDVNMDGYGDAIIGAPGYGNPLPGEAGEGGAFVFHGSPSGLDGSATRPVGNPTNADWAAQSDQPGAGLGYAVGTAGDVNGDGYADVIVGAPFYGDPFPEETGEGGSFVYHGSSTGLDGEGARPQGTPANAEWAAQGEAQSAEFGGSVACAGDVNGDGYADVIVGAPNFGDPPAEAGKGAAFVYHGSAVGLTGGPDATRLDADWHVESNEPGAFFGFSVASAGDVNADGYGDVIVGAPFSTNDQSGEGQAFLYLGNDGGAVSLNPRQRGYYSHDVIAPLGLSDHEERFNLAVIGRTPFGRGQVGLEWEVKPLGTLFDGTGLERSLGWYDSDVGGTEVEEDVTNLDDGTIYHWRLRLLYRPTTTPFKPAGRWITPPRNGWQEADLQTEGGYCPDADGDGYGSPGTPFCVVPDQLDCDDSDPDINPGMGEIPDDGIDQDCNGADTITCYRDFDQDGYGDDGGATRLAPDGVCNIEDQEAEIAGDCQDFNANAWARPGEVGNLGFAADKLTMTWQPPTDFGGSVWGYDVLRAWNFPGFGSAYCVESFDGTDQEAQDLATPPAGDTYFYLVRAANQCPSPLGDGPLGTDSQGQERAGGSCP